MLPSSSHFPTNSYSQLKTHEILINSKHKPITDIPKSVTNTVTKTVTNTDVDTPGQLFDVNLGHYQLNYHLNNLNIEVVMSS